MAKATDASLIGQSHNESEHGTSTEYLDPWCDICFDKTGDRIKPDGFCPECNSFMCGSCTLHHKLWPILKSHKVLRGKKMPKSQADKPVKYPTCTTHAGDMKDYYCVNHSEMICNQCREQIHSCCRSMSLLDICKTLGATHIQQFGNDIASLKEQIISTKEALQNNASDIDKQQENIIKAAKDERDKIVSKADKLCEDTIAKASKACEQKKLFIADQVLSLEDIVLSLDESANEITKKLTVPFDQNMFIQLQDIVANLRECKTDIDSIKKKLHKITLTFSTSSDVSAFLSASKDLGDVNETTSEFDNLIPLLEVFFPQRKRPKNLSEIKYHKRTTVNIRTTQDKESCRTIGMYVTTEGILFVSDEANKSLKVFSQDKKLLSRFSFSDFTGGIGVMDNVTAVISTKDNKLYFLNISDPENISINGSVSLSYWAVDLLTEYGGDLFVACRDAPRSVKMIDRSGREKWSVSTDPIGKSLFTGNRSIIVSAVENTPKLIVTDWGKNTLTFLNPRNGEVLNIIDVKGKSPHGITSDHDGNVYVCYYDSMEISVFSPDFQQSRILLSAADLNGSPIDIVFDGTLKVLYISYYDNDIIDCFQLS